MKKIAHRGYKTKLIKENTLEAFKNAEANGFVGIECDIRVTKDKKMVIHHDAFIDRTSNGTGLLSEKTYIELSKLNFGSKESPSKIPLLEEVLKKCKGLKVLEIKTEVDLQSMLPLVDDNTFFISFDTSYMFRLKKEYPSLRFGVLNYALNSKKDYDLDAICLLDSLANEELVMKYLKKGITVFIYGIVGKINYQRDYENLYYIVEKKD